MTTDQKLKFENLPASLRASHRWLVWKYGEKENAKGKKPKLPVDLQSGRCVDKANAACYSFADVAAATGYEGIGFLPVHPYIGIDLDNCIADGVLSEFAKKVVQHCNSYTELSPSGKGLRIWVKGNAPKVVDASGAPHCRAVKDGLIEIYPDSPSSNYLTCTGDQVEGSPADVRALSDEEIRQLYAFAHKPETKERAVTTAPRLTRLQRFNLLSLGQWQGLQPSQSEADLEYCCFLAEARDCDRVQMDADFRRSPLFREKWDHQRGANTYGNNTLDLAIQKTKTNPKNNKNDEVDPETWENEFPALCDVEVPAFREIVKDLIIEGGIHLFAGLFESYKTMAVLEIASAILQKRDAFDFFPVYSSHSFLYLCPDMGIALLKEYAAPFGLSDREKTGDRFRVMRAKADVLHSVDSAVMKRAVNGRILVLDTMLDYANIRDAFQSAEWIEFFQKLRGLLESNGCVAIILLAHATKTGGKEERKIIDATEFLKDSVTVGGKNDVAFGLKPVPNMDKVHVERLKGRGFKKRKFCFSIAVRDEQGNSNLDRGHFPICDKPEDKVSYGDHVPRKKTGKDSALTLELYNEIVRLKNAKKSNAEIGEKYGVSGQTVGNWLKTEPNMLF
jgi:hypothetical protein